MSHANEVEEFYDILQAFNSADSEDCENLVFKLWRLSKKDIVKREALQEQRVDMLDVFSAYLMMEASSDLYERNVAMIFKVLCEFVTPSSHPNESKDIIASSESYIQQNTKHLLGHPCGLSLLIIDIIFETWFGKAQEAASRQTQYWRSEAERMEMTSNAARLLLRLLRSSRTGDEARSLRQVAWEDRSIQDLLKDLIRLALGDLNNLDSLVTIMFISDLLSLVGMLGSSSHQQIMSCMVLIHLLRWKPLVSFEPAFEELWKSPSKARMFSSHAYLNRNPVSRRSVGIVLNKMQNKYFKGFVLMLLKRSPVALWSSPAVMDQIPWDVMIFHMTASSMLLHVKGESTEGSPLHSSILFEIESLLTTYFLNNHFDVVLRILSNGLQNLYSQNAPQPKSDKSHANALLNRCSTYLQPHKRAELFWEVFKSDPANRTQHLLHAIMLFCFNLFHKYAILNVFCTNAINDNKTQLLDSHFAAIVQLCAAILVVSDEFSMFTSEPNHGAKKTNPIFHGNTTTSQTDRTTASQIRLWLTPCALQASSWMRRHLVKPQLWHHIVSALICLEVSDRTIRMLPVPPKSRHNGATPGSAQNNGRRTPVLSATPSPDRQHTGSFSVLPPIVKPPPVPTSVAPAVERPSSPHTADPSPPENDDPSFGGEIMGHSAFFETMKEVLQTQRERMERYKGDLNGSLPERNGELGSVGHLFAKQQLRMRSATYSVLPDIDSTTDGNGERLSKSAQYPSSETGGTTGAEDSMDGANSSQITFFLKTFGFSFIGDLQSRVASSKHMKTPLASSLRYLLEEQVKYLYTFARLCN